jgi:hypothetical protein
VPKCLGAGLVGRALEDEVVFVQRGAAAGGVGEDRVDVGGESGEVFAGEILCGGEVAGVPREAAAAALRLGHDDFDALLGEDGDGGGVDVGREDLLRAAGEERDAGTAFADGRGDARP